MKSIEEKIRKIIEEKIEFKKWFVHSTFKHEDLEEMIKELSSLFEKECGS